MKRPLRKTYTRLQLLKDSDSTESIDGLHRDPEYNFHNRRNNLEQQLNVYGRRNRHTLIYSLH